ncbi:hypothetical protein [Mycolicibacter hiberniae]|uniref:Uncharacterized protein n=1 Tax=Mycolicibacter hiberniae TaxID=29314 RepID=A0A7I7X7R6_9MYCO|nr:hypothetical protein [Mycolicibacter hiberniae]MCV7087557.1 hypothetical protein [Mycolicibacter hiberniae]ORV69118.1 hypothetical protein AWC09_14205 [Mycolicibacter hiberniae]BBZ24923.1 hypothetical protein MHIB_33410 [Mycolicibacter hiberniae]
MSKLEVLKSRTLWRVLAVDIVAPLGAIGGLLLVGLSLDWPVWYVSLCSVLVLLIVEGMVVNFLLLRRDAVTVGTDNERPGLRFGVVGLAAAALIAAAVLGYLRWTVPDRDLEADASEAVKTAVAMAEAAATVAPANPDASIDKAATYMVPDRVSAFRESIGRTATEMANRNIAVDAQTLSAGVEALGPSAARVAVVMRSVQTVASQQVKQSVVPVRVTLTKRGGQWLVLEMSPIHAR